MARSFSVAAAEDADALALALAEARTSLKSPAAGLVFVSGALTKNLPAVANRIRAEWRGIPAVVVPAAGVLTERAEIEGGSAAAGLLWSGGRATTLVVPDEPPNLAEAVAHALTAAVGQRPA